MDGAEHLQMGPWSPDHGRMGCNHFLALVEIGEEFRPELTRCPPNLSAERSVVRRPRPRFYQTPFGCVLWENPPDGKHIARQDLSFLRGRRSLRLL